MDNPKAELQRRVDETSQRAVALELGISAQYLCDVLMDRRQPGKKILAALGIERQITYRKINGRGRKSNGTG
jgi:hypothetical protein